MRFSLWKKPDILILLIAILTFYFQLRPIIMERDLSPQELQAGPAPKPRRKRTRKPRRPQPPKVISLNPMAQDFTPPHMSAEHMRSMRKWMDRFEQVQSRPQFRPVDVATVAKAKKGKLQILSVRFMGFFILEGTWPSIMQALYAKIIEATERSFEEDAALQATAKVA
jgi:hypothetical protein